MAYKTTEERVKAVAKYLLKEFKESEDKKCISIYDHFTSTSSNKYNGWHMVFHGDKEIDFGELSDEAFGDVTCKIADAICAKMKVKKTEILYRDECQNTVHHGTWYAGWDSHYTTTKRITIVRPCKEFFAINKKLKALGLQEINFRDWYYCEVGGKRSSIFSRYYHYYAESQKKCQKVLDYLKGKKKLTYQFINVDDLEDRRRGEEYETEWYGSESKQIYFTDSKGHTTSV
jgi:hypothetical protein